MRIVNSDTIGSMWECVSAITRRSLFIYASMFVMRLRLLRYVDSNASDADRARWQMNGYDMVQIIDTCPSTLWANKSTDHVFSIDLFDILHFEMAQINACRNVFPSSTIRRCYFHCAQSLIRNADGYGLKTIASTNHDLRLFMKRISACAFLPPHLFGVFVRYLTKDKEIIPNLNDAADQLNLTKFIAYFLKYWVNGYFRNYWSHWLNFGPRTNIHVEGQHNKLHQRFENKLHPTLSEVIHYFQTSQNTTRIRLEALSNLAVYTAAASYTPLPILQQNQRLTDAMQTFVQKHKFFSIRMDKFQIMKQF